MMSSSSTSDQVDYMQYIDVHIINRALSRKLQPNTTTCIFIRQNSGSVTTVSMRSKAHSIIHPQTLETLVGIKLRALMFASAFRRESKIVKSEY
jgi:hypothetical protein